MRRISSASTQGGLAFCILCFAIFLSLSPVLLQSVQMSMNSGLSAQSPSPGNTANVNQSYWYEGGCSNNTLDYKNSGLRTFIEVKPQFIQAFLAFWVSESFSNGLWAQVGYYIFHGSTPVGFYQIWNITSHKEVSTSTTSVSVGVHSFSFSLDSGTIDFSIDGKSFASYNIGQASPSPSYPICALSEEGYSSSSFPFSSISFKVAIEILKSGFWTSVISASSFGNSWGIQGNDQNSSIPQNQIIVGSNLNVIPTSSLLWT